MTRFDWIREHAGPLLHGVAVCSVTATTWLIDQGSKWLATQLLQENQPRALAAPWLSLHLRHNPNGAFDLFAGLPAGGRLVLLFALGALALMTIFEVSVRALGWTRRLAVALGLLLGGAVGNGTDRMLRRVVVDFLDVRIGAELRLPTFNLADVAITLGSLLLFVLLWQSAIRPDSRRQPKQSFFEEEGK